MSTYKPGSEHRMYRIFVGNQAVAVKATPRGPVSHQLVRDDDGTLFKTQAQATDIAMKLRAVGCIDTFRIVPVDIIVGEPPKPIEQTRTGAILSGSAPVQVAPVAPLTPERRAELSQYRLEGERNGWNGGWLVQRGQHGIGQQHRAVDDNRP